MLSAFLLTFSAAIAPAPRVGSVPFDELVRFSDTIVVARVTAVHEVSRVAAGSEVENISLPPHGSDAWKRKPKLAIAEADVLRCIEGERNANKVLFLAEGTWTCDTSTAVVGETVLLFLERADWLAEEGDVFTRALGAIANGVQLHVIAHSGRGRMPIRGSVGEERVTLSSITPPKTGPQLTDPRTPLLAEVEACAARFVESQGASLHASGPRRADGASFDVRIWQDGYRVWSFADERVERPATASVLERVHAAFTAADDALWSATLEPTASRARLTFVKDGEQRELRLPHTDALTGLGPEVEAAVRLWVTVADLAELGTENDPRLVYRAFLESAR